jgi:hypothetical protein
MLTMRRIACICVITALSLGNGTTQSQEPRHAPQIKPNIKSNGSINDQQNAQPENGNLPTAPPAAYLAVPNGGYPTKGSYDGHEQRTEFWSPFTGIELKITDSLLILVTCVLAIFTGLLWCSTKKLWKEASTASGIAQQSANLRGLFSVGPIATEFLNIRNPSQATCNVNVIAGIVCVNLPSQTLAN